MNTIPDRTVHILISGRVQGVGFRAWMCDRAQVLELDGWVRNTRDNRVEAVLSGRLDDVNTLLEACRNGPKWARVDHIEQHPASAFPGSGFTITSMS